MTTSIIVAAAANNVIGKNNQLLWHLPADLKYFKNLTTDHHVIMGRKTYEAIGHPLPNRTNIILSHRVDYQADGCMVVNSIDNALQIAIENKETEAFIIGGGEIYKQALAKTDKIYLTKVDVLFEGDTFFPELDKDKWKLISQEARNPDDKHSYPYAFLVYEKI